MSQAVTAACRCRNDMTGKGDNREARPVTEAYGRVEPQDENKYDLAALERALMQAARRLRVQVAALPLSEEPVD